MIPTVKDLIQMIQAAPTDMKSGRKSDSWGIDRPFFEMFEEAMRKSNRNSVPLPFEKVRELVGNKGPDSPRHFALQLQQKFIDSKLGMKVGMKNPVVNGIIVPHITFTLLSPIPDSSASVASQQVAESQPAL